MCLALVFALLVGGGFSYFYLGKDIVTGSQGVTVRPGSQTMLAEFGLQTANASNNWKSYDSFEYKIILDANNVYLCTSENISVPAQFKAQPFVYNMSSIKKQGYTLSFICDVTIKDPDARGISIRTETVGIATSQSTYSYAYSNSILDYMRPVEAVTSSTAMPFEVLSQSDDGKQITYRSYIKSIDIAATIASAGHLNFAYNSYSITQGTITSSGTMAPSDNSNKMAVGAAMSSVYSAMENASIDVVFSLILVKNNTEGS